MEGAYCFAIHDLADDQAGEVGDCGEGADVAHGVEIGDPAFVGLVAVSGCGGEGGGGVEGSHLGSRVYLLVGRGWLGQSLLVRGIGLHSGL